MADFIKKYKIEFFYERSDGIEIRDNVDSDLATLVQAVTICRVDVERGFHESLDVLVQHRLIGVAAASWSDTYHKAHGRQVALLRATADLDKDNRRFLLENWFLFHRAIKGAKAGDPTKFKRLVELVEWSEKAKAWMAEPLFYEGPKESTKSA